MVHFIHLVIVLLLLSPFIFSYHVLLLLSRLAFVAPVAPLGVSLIDPLGAQGPPPTVTHCRGSFSFILSSSCFSCHRLLVITCSYHQGAHRASGAPYSSTLVRITAAQFDPQEALGTRSPKPAVSLLPRYPIGRIGNPGAKHNQSNANINNQNQAQNKRH